MPFRSKQQVRYLYSQHPDIAKKWHDEYKFSGKEYKSLPKKVKKKRKRKPK